MKCNAELRTGGLCARTKPDHRGNHLSEEAMANARYKARRKYRDDPEYRAESVERSRKFRERNPDYYDEWAKNNAEHKSAYMKWYDRNRGRTKS